MKNNLNYFYNPDRIKVGNSDTVKQTQFTQFKIITNPL